MKIGILSMQRVVNYGSFLQAYAMKEILKNLGHECYFIDIKAGRKINNEDVIHKQENKIKFILKRLDSHIIKRIKHKSFSRLRINRFHNEFFPILGIGKETSYKSNYDAIVIGSDEVFNCTQDAKWGFAKTLLGEGLNSDNIISYAASCGNTTIEKVSKLGIDADVENAMKYFQAISVRDKNTKKFAEKFTGKSVYEHIDPTLIYDFGELVPKNVPEKNYILIYAYDGRISDKETIKKIREFAKNENKQVVSVGLYQSWCDKQILCTPFELLSYFKNADYIVTDTFHGSVFSIKYNKQFVTIVRESNKQKMTDLLERFRLTDRLMEIPNQISNKLFEAIDYKYTNSEIEKYQKSATEYLNKYLVMIN